MAKAEYRWVRVKVLDREAKASIAAACAGFIVQALTPRLLPEIRPTTFNYPVDIHGAWRGHRYSFITRYRSGSLENLGEEFDTPFARLDHVEDYLAEIRFDLMWRRHTGKWHRLHPLVSLGEAFELMSTDELLSPV